MHGAVGHHVAKGLRQGAQQCQATQRHRAGGGTVTVVISHHANAPTSGQRIGQKHRGSSAAMQAFWRQQASQAIVEFIGLAHAAASKQPSQQGRHTGLLKRPNSAGRRISVGNGWGGGHGFKVHAATRPDGALTTTLRVFARLNGVQPRTASRGVSPHKVRLTG